MVATSFRKCSESVRVKAAHWINAATRPRSAWERVEQNERLFREVNERIAEVTERVLDGGAADADFYCECAQRASSASG
jgi:hypothetical protein